MAEKTKATWAIEWIEENLAIPGGEGVGQPFILADFQRCILIDIFDNEVPIRKAIISMGRGAAKTVLCAAILALFLVGPFRRINTTLVSTALSKEQSGLTFEAIANMIAMSPKLSRKVTSGELVIRSFKKQIANLKDRITYTALSSETKDKQGGAAYVAVHDECGSITSERSELISAVDNGMAKNKGSIAFYISTQAAKDAYFFSKEIDKYKDGHEPSVYVKVFSCPMDVDPLSPEALNYHPAYNTFGDREHLEFLQRAGRNDPAALADFQQFFLNQRVDAAQTYLSREDWKKCGNKPEAWDGKEVWLALDLSENRDLTSLTLIHKNEKDGRLSVHPFFFLPDEGLIEKGKKDGFAWDSQVKMGNLQVCHGPIVDYSLVAELIYDISIRAKIVKIAYDRRNIKWFKPHMIEAGLGNDWIDAHMYDFAQNATGYTGPINILTGYILKEMLAHGNHPIMNYCFENVKLYTMSNGNKMFQKKSPNQKIDGMATLAMAMAAISEFDTGGSDKGSYLQTQDLFII